MDMKKLQREVLKLCDQGFGLVVDAEHEGDWFDADVTAPDELALMLEEWYASAVQIMVATGFRSIGRFEKLYEDGSFSIPDHVRSGAYTNAEFEQTGEHAEMISRLWRMCSILKSLPAAIAAASGDEVHGLGAQDILEYLQGALGRVDEGNMREVGPGARSHMEEAVNLAMARFGVVVEKKPDHKRACFQDKVEALVKAGRVNGNESAKLVRMYCTFNKTAHPAPSEPVETLRMILADAIVVVREKLLTVK